MSLDVFKLDGRVALITGGNRGLGFAMAKALAEAGANVVVTSRQEDRAMESAATLATITGQRTLGIAVDVTDAAQIETAFRLVVERDVDDGKIGQADIESLHGGLAIAVRLDRIAVSRERRRVIFAQSRLVLDYGDLLFHG